MDKFDKWLMGIISALFVIIGIALCFTFTAGAGLVIGSALLAGGVSGFMATFSGADWGSFWSAVVSGTICGAISGIASPLISQIAGKFAGMMGHQLSNYLIHMAVSVIGHMAVSFVTNGIQNLFHGQSFTTNWKQALISGAIIGAVTSSIYIIQDIGVENIVNKIKQFYEEYGTSPMVTQFKTWLRDNVSNLISRIPESYAKMGIQFCWDKLKNLSTPHIISLIQNNLHYVAEFGVSAATQYIMHGEVDWMLTCVQSIAYGCVNRSLASRNLNRNLVRQVPPPGLIYNSNSQRNAEQTNIPTRNEEVQEPANPNPSPEVLIPDSKEPIQTPTRTSEPPTYEDAMRDPHIPQPEPSAPQENILPELMEPRPTAEQPPQVPEPQIAKPENVLLKSLPLAEPEASLSSSAHVQRQELPEEPLINVATRSQGKQSEKKKIKGHHQSLKSPITQTSTSALSEEATSQSTDIIVNKTLSASTAEDGTVVTVSTPRNDNKKGDNYIMLSPNVKKMPEISLVEEPINAEFANVTHMVPFGFEKTQLSDENEEDEFEVIENYESFAVGSIDEQAILGAVIKNIETELFRINKLFQEQERNQINQVCGNAPNQIYQYNTMEYAERIGLKVQGRKVQQKNSSYKAKAQSAILETFSKLKLVKHSPTESYLPYNRNNGSQIQREKAMFVCPFIIFDEDEAKYQLVDPEIWPEFPQVADGVRVIAVSGARASGRTTFIHSLAYTLGYSLTEEQAVMSRFPTGVFMYLFPEENLLILDCVDSIARIDDNLAPAALTIELFCYLISDHRIHHVVTNDVKDVASYLEQCEATTKTLFRAGGYVELHGGRMVTLLARYTDKFSLKQLEKYEKLKDEHKNLTEERVKLLQNCIDTVNDPKQFVDNNGEEIHGKKQTAEEALSKAFEDRTFDLTIEKLLILPENYSSNEQQLYHSEINNIVNNIMTCTPIHHTFQKAVIPEYESEKLTFKELVSEVWYKVAENVDLFKSTSNAINKHTVSQNGDKFNVQKYLEDVMQHFGGVNGVKEAMKWIDETAKEEASKSEGNATFVFRGIARVAQALLKARNDRNIVYFEHSVHTALQGLHLFFGENEKSFELMAVKAVVEDTNVIEILMEDKIIFNYAGAWSYFQFVAFYLFRLELISHNIIEKAVKVLKKLGNGNEDQKIKANIYATVSMLMFTDVNIILGLSIPETKNMKTIDDEDLLKILYEFEEKAEELIFPFKEGKVFNNRKEIHEAYGKMMEYPKTYFNVLKYAERRNLSYDDLDPPIKYKFECKILKLFYNAIGYHVARNVISDSHLCMPKFPEILEDVPISSNNISIQKNCLNLWTNLGILSITFENLLQRILLETEIKPWLISYRSNLNLGAHVSPTLQLCNILIYSESIHDYIPHSELQLLNAVSNQQKDFSDIQIISKRKELAKHYRHIALDICEKTKLMKALTIFCEKTFDFSMLEEAEIWIMHFEGLLKQGLEKDDKEKCLFIFFSRRFELAKKLAALASLGAMTLNDEENFKSPDTVSKALKLLFSIAELLNKLIVFYNIEGSKDTDFFNSSEHEKTLPTNTEMWENLTKIYGILANHIIIRGNFYHKKTNLESHIYEHGLMYVLWFIYNFASISKITYGDIVKAVPDSLLLTFEQLKSQGEMNLVHKMEDYCNIEVFNNSNKSVQIIQIAAYIWAKYATESDEDLRETFHGEFNILRNIFDASVKSWRDNELKCRQIEKIKEQLAARLENSQILNDFVSQLAAQQPVATPYTDDAMRYIKIVNGQMAIDNVMVLAHGHESFENWRFHASSNPEESLYNSLKKDNTKAASLMFLLIKANQEKTKLITKYFERLLENIPNDDEAPILTLRTIKNGVINKRVEEMVNLKYAIEVFESLGFTKTESAKDGIKLKATVASINEKKYEINEFLKLDENLTAKNAVLNFSLESIFENVNELTQNEDDNIKVFEYLTMPKEFIHGDVTLESYTVKSLRESHARDGIKIQYALIRVNLENGKTVQAVFFSEMTLMAVISSLADFLECPKKNIELFRKGNQNRQLSLNQSLSSLGFIPGGYLKAIFNK